MNTSRNIHLAFDLGSSSGRLMIAWESNKHLYLEEIHRFTNDVVKVGDKIYWDFLRLFQEVKIGIQKAVNLGYYITSIGVDTWGVDYGFLNASEELMTNPFHYRDPRTSNIPLLVNKTMPDNIIFEKTGIQSMAINTLYQLYSDSICRPEILKNAHAFLMMPDLFNFFLTGEKYCEYTIASTSQLLDITSQQWCNPILEHLDVCKDIFPPIIQPGQILGYLKSSICQELGIDYEIPIIAVGSHDTASAVASIPLQSPSEAYLCCGSWSLFGVELNSPCLSNQSRECGFTNEGGVNKTITFLKNINGLWFFQSLKQSPLFNELSYEDISLAASNCKNKSFCIDVTDPMFLYTQSSMDHSVSNYCKLHNQNTPITVGEIAYAVYNGLVSEYSKTRLQLESLLGHPLDTLHIVGGGSQDTFLCQHIADTLNITVIAGPLEASALGNVLMQLYALGRIDSLSQGRTLIQKSFLQQVYTPRKDE